VASVVVAIVEVTMAVSVVAAAAEIAGRRWLQSSRVLQRAETGVQRQLR
jgi:hypothetical protein